MAVKGVRAHLRDTTAGRSSFGSIAASGASKGAHTHMICSSSDSSISSSDEYALSSEWVMSRVARAFGKSTCADGTRLRLASSRALRGGAGFAVCA